ncbi:Uncharacterized protein Rs2_09066 [Raphanus sativus]|nr:Uncharacterized protein Rs2_09066 [Raphanus sativus]
MFIVLAAVRFSGDSRKAFSNGSSFHCVLYHCNSLSSCSRSVRQSVVAKELHRKSHTIPLQSPSTLSAIDDIDPCFVDRFCYCREVITEATEIQLAERVNCSGVSLDAICLSSGDISPVSGDCLQLCKSPTMLSEESKPSGICSWAMPVIFIFIELVSSTPNLSGSGTSEMDVVVLMLVVRLQRISGGFTGAFELRLMLYLSCAKINFPVSSPCWFVVLSVLDSSFSMEEWISPPYLFSMKGDGFPNLVSRFGFSFFTSEGWFSTSLYVTISLPFDSVVKAMSLTHSSFISNSLSPSHEELSRSRPAHGPAYSNPSAFSPEAYDFFHSKSSLPDNNPPRNSHSLPFLSPSPSPSETSNVEADTQGSKVSSDEHIGESSREEGRGETVGIVFLLFAITNDSEKVLPQDIRTNRTIVAFYKSMRKHATIPFKLEKPASSESPKAVQSRPKVDTKEG